MGWIVGLLVFFGFLFFLFRFPKQTLGSIGVVIGLAALLFYVLIFKPNKDRLDCTPEFGQFKLE